MSYNDATSAYRSGNLPRPRRRNENLHLEILRLVALGMRNKDIAKELGCSIRLVSKVKNAPSLQLQLIRFVEARDQSLVNFDERIRQRIIATAEKSLNRLKQCLRPVDEGGTDDKKLILAIAKESLDRCGFPPLKLVKDH